MSRDRIPAELRALRQWTCWRRIQRPDGKVAKKPLQVSGRSAKSTDPSTWNTFEACIAASHRFDGIGFMFSAANGLVGVDLDHVRDPETGITEEWAREIIRELNSYTELSQSGTGWHIIVRGQLNGSGNRRGRIEVYSAARFFVVTGIHAAGTPDTIEARDVSNLQRRMLAGLDPKLIEPTNDSGVREVGRDESAEDFKVVASVIRRFQTRNARLIEAGIQKLFPERYEQRAKVKGDRGSVGYWAYTIKNALERIPNENGYAEVDAVSAVRGR